MLSLNDPRWAELQHAYGSAANVPALLRQAESMPEYRSYKSEPYYTLCSSLCHQGSIYTASYAAVPHLVELVRTPDREFRWPLLTLVQAIESARLDRIGPPMPDYLSEPYFEALRSVPAIATRLLCGKLSELECRAILAACAAASGFGRLAEAIGDLSPETVEKLREL